MFCEWIVCLPALHYPESFSRRYAEPGPRADGGSAESAMYNKELRQGHLLTQPRLSSCCQNVPTIESENLVRKLAFVECLLYTRHCAKHCHFLFLAILSFNFLLTRDLE